MKLKVIIRDQKTLVLEEDAKKGDYIDLNDLTTVDLNLIEKAINENKDKVYIEKMESLRANLQKENETLVLAKQIEYEKETNKLKMEIESLKKDLSNKESEVTNKYILKIKDVENDNISKEKDIEARYDKEIERLKAENIAYKERESLIKEKLIAEKDIEVSKLIQESQNKLNENKSNYDKLINELQNSLTNKDDEKKIALLNKEKEVKEIFEKEIINLKEELKSKSNALQELTFQKLVKNVKQTGEDLEAWCDNEVTLYMQNGLENCEWIKDNKVIKEQDEAKGSKADYILNIYASNERNKDELLTSICMDMKDENPTSVNKKHNEDYYNQLDRNRIKKNSKYAVLVSNLERKENDLPFFKVRDYQDMYVVRPEYLMVFLNLVISLNVKFKDLLLRAKKEDELFIESTKLTDEFESLKKTYLDKPLESLEKQVKEIGEQTDKIITAADKIKEANRKIVNGYIDEIKNKLDRFNIKKINKKLDLIQ